jgi:hypothetical protein
LTRRHGQQTQGSVIREPRDKAQGFAAHQHDGRQLARPDIVNGVICDNFVPTPCIVCDRPTCATDTLALAQSQSDYRAWGAVWFCARCAEMDDTALLDAAAKSFSDELEQITGEQVECVEVKQRGNDD